MDPEYRGTADGRDFETGSSVHAGMPRRDLDHVIALYDAEIRFTDSQIGVLVDEVKALGLLDRTLVVITADHGEEFFEHGKKGHRKALYDESVRVPLIMRYPPLVPSGRRVGSQVRLVDVAPTILAVAERESPTRAPHSGARDAGGQSLLDRLQREPSASAGVPAFSLLGAGLVAVRTDDAKLIAHLDGAEESVEVYDLADDPGERTNLAGRGTPAEDRLRALLSAWRAELGQEQAPATPTDLDDRLQDRLRKLGYLGE
jgi:arylsulfatase A-like enzyme